MSFNRLEYETVFAFALAVYRHTREPGLRLTAVAVMDKVEEVIGAQPIPVTTRNAVEQYRINHAKGLKAV